LLSPDGGFYSAQDADSEGVEGKYYLWTYKELSAELSKDEILFLEKYFNISEKGNYNEENTSGENGVNILHLAADHMDKFDDVIMLFQPIRKKLFSIRKERIPPILDNKILTDWNGLMIYALSSAGFVLNKPKITDMAKAAYSFVLSNQSDYEKLHHSVTNGKKNSNSILDDYAFMGLAGLNLFEVTGQAAYLVHSIKTAQYLNELFYDTEKHLFRLSERFFPEKNYSLFDNAYPSGNSAAFLFFSRLYHYTKEEMYSSGIMRLYESIPEIIHKHPSSVSFLLQTLLDVHSDFNEVVMTHDSCTDITGVLETIRCQYIPNMTLAIINSENIDRIAGINSFYETFRQYLNGINIFTCGKEGCSLPGSSLVIS
jgi:hypothetical protein